MKSVFLSLLVLLFSFSSFAQAHVPDSIASKEITLNFEGKYHALIYKLMPNKGTADGINYVNQLVKAVAIANKRDSVGKLVFDTAQVMSTVVSYSMVANTFYTMGSYPERLTASDNTALKEILIGELSKPQYFELYKIIAEIIGKNAEETELLRSAGIAEIMAIKPQ